MEVIITLETPLSLHFLPILIISWATPTVALNLSTTEVRQSLAVMKAQRNC